MLTSISMPSVDAAQRSGRVLRWLRREGDFLREGDLVAEVAAKGATMEIEAPQSGQLIRILVAAGEGAAVGARLALVEAGPLPHIPHHAGASAPEGGAISPRARRLAREHGLDLSHLAGSGPDGRIVERDVLPLLAGGRADGARLDGAQMPPARIEIFRPPLVAALEWTPQAALEADCRIDALEAMRSRIETAAGTRISLVDCAVRGLALALQTCPRANVVQSPDGFSQARASDVAAVMTLDGRIVAPAICAAEKMSLAQIATARASFSAANLAPEHSFGGTSLVANVGAYGLRRLFPVMTPPWTSILALGVAEKRIVVENDAPAVALMLSVTLTVDRRAIDETHGATLLAAFKALMENPYRLVI